MREVKSEQVRLESFWADGEWLCCPYIGLEFILPLWQRSRDFPEQPLFALNNSGTSRPTYVVLTPGRVVWPVFGGRWVQFCWRAWRPVPSYSFSCFPYVNRMDHRGGGSHERIWVDWKQGKLLDTQQRISRRGWGPSQEQVAVAQVGG